MDARISTSLPAHPKTKKLARRLGPAGPLACIYLFLWVAANRSDGDLSGLTDEDLELAVDWAGDEGQFVKTMAEVGFLDGDECARFVHDWSEHNPWAAGANDRSEASRWAALCKRYGRDGAANRMPDYAAGVRPACAPHAPRINPQCEPDAPLPSPIPSPSPLPLQEQSVQPSAAPSRFDEFWQIYPNKKGKQEAEKRWRRDKLDGMADQIIAHVRLMTAEDDGWKRNYVPMGSTYLNQARWTDVPQSAPNRTNGTHNAAAKLTPAERIAVNIARDNGGQIPVGYEGNRNVVAALGGDLRPQVDERLRGHGNGFGGSDMGEGIKWLNGDPGR